MRWARDDLDQSGVGVVHEPGHEQSGRQAAGGEVDVDPDRGVGVGDGLGVEVADQDLEEIGQHLGICGQPLDSTVGVVQAHQVRWAVGAWTATGRSAELGEQLP